MDFKSKIAFALSVLAVGGLHFVLSFLLAFAAGISPEGSIYRIISRILWFPLEEFGTSSQTGDEPAWIGWALMILISLCWGLVICGSIRYLARRNG